jgi:hypothetical protein
MSVFDEFDEMQRFEFVQVAMNLADIAIDETSGLTDTTGLVLDDRSE